MKNPAKYLCSHYGHGGNIQALNRVRNSTDNSLIDFSANINPLGPPEWLRPLVSKTLADIVHYPDPDAHHLVTAIARQYNLESETIVVGNGTTELLYLLPGILPGKKAIIPVPSYIDYARIMEINGIEVEPFHLLPENSFQVDCHLLGKRLQGGEVVILGSPNNPTGASVDSSQLRSLILAHPLTFFVVDEAFIDFDDQATSVAGCAENCIVMKSLTKFFAIPGLRLGFAVFPDSLVGQIKKLLPPWTVNTIAQAVGARAVADSDYRRNTIEYNVNLKQSLKESLGCFPGLQIFNSSANFFLIRLQNQSVKKLGADMLARGFAIRDCSNYNGLDDSYFRIAVRSAEENSLFIEALGQLLPSSHNRATGKAKNADRKYTLTGTPSLMFQGTSSNAGKSILSAAMCRILLQDGVRVAPFKSQNMSLNSFVTKDGLEMGRAQVVQAQAARLDPDVRMNPILLKPNSDTGSQVIVKGRVVGNMRVKEYVAYKQQAMQEAKDCYDQLAAEYEAIILEGAGSPGEVNLKSHDIVNMPMARYARAPVVLVGDIDRGGVYASFVGTMEVLAEWERNCIAGFLVNRFRGDASLLDSAHTYVMSHTGLPVLGVVPFLKNLGLPEEDSVSFKEGCFNQKRPDRDHIEIACISLPHISNFTDIEPFISEPDVYLRIVNNVAELGTPDAVIIPGSKNVVNDMAMLVSSGLGAALVRLAEKGVEIVGICGGYQMLGKTITDPHGLESSKAVSKGLGMLDMDTRLASDKCLTRQQGIHIGSNLPIHGYEIHHGVTRSNLDPVARFSDNTTCGSSNTNLPIWGTYLHGIFDDDSFRRWFIDQLRIRCGLVPVNTILAVYDLEPAFDRLALTVRESVDMDQIYTLLGI